MSSCILCRSNRPLSQCAICDRSICKDCLEVLEPEAFLFHPKPPKIFRGKTYCFVCFEKDIQPELDTYQNLLDQAEVLPMHKRGQKNLLRVRKKEQIAATTKDHLEEGHAIFQLKVLAVYKKFDALCDLETSFKKVRKHGYEHKEWSAKAHFCLLKPKNNEGILEE